MNTFQQAILRILIKRRSPVMLSSLIDGFPDYTEDDVLAAISALKELGLVIVPELNPCAHVSIAPAKRRQVFEIVSTGDDIRVEKPISTPMLGAARSGLASGKVSRSSLLLTSRSTRIIAIASLFVLGIVGTIGATFPSTGSGTTFVSYDSSPSEASIYSDGPSGPPNTLPQSAQHSSEVLIFVEHCHGPSDGKVRE